MPNSPPVRADNGAPVKPDGNLPLRGYKGSIWEGGEEYSEYTACCCAIFAWKTSIRICQDRLGTSRREQLKQKGVGLCSAGYREPGIAWWPGKIAAGTKTDALAVRKTPPSFFARRALVRIIRQDRLRTNISMQAGREIEQNWVVFIKCKRWQATYDIFPTVLKLAGAPPPPPGLVIDGVDLADALFKTDGSIDRCITFYNYPHAATAADPINLSAMRCGDFKVYWWVAGGAPAPIKSGVQPEGRPAVFNLAKVRTVLYCTVSQASY